MRTETIKNKVKFLKEHCGAYIKDVHRYMINTNWTWYKSDFPPTEEEISNTLFSLLDELNSDTTEISTGGFTVQQTGSIGIAHRTETDCRTDFTGMGE